MNLTRFRPLTWTVWKAYSHQVMRLNVQSNTPKPISSRKARSESDRRIKSIIDCRTIKVFGGKGGDGCISLSRIAHNPKAGPDGGDGGSGGHVIFKAVTNRNSLDHLSTIIKAADGEKGGNQDCAGKNAKHTIIEVPIGTLFRSSDGQILADLDQEGSMFVAARGGAGGKGNHYFTSDVNQAPEIAEYGAEGEELAYFVEMKTIAHIGLVGFPNAGKSSFLRAVSRARPKVATYPFTTLQPHVGVVKYDDLEQLAVADLPGIISGAHRNRGLGFAFLRHIERCMCLLYIIDASLDEPWQQLEILRFEIGQYKRELLRRPCAVVANKIDLECCKDNLPKLQEQAQKLQVPFFAVSARESIGINPVLAYVRELYDNSIHETSSET